MLFRSPIALLVSLPYCLWFCALVLALPDRIPPGYIIVAFSFEAQTSTTHIQNPSVNPTTHINPKPQISHHHKKKTFTLIFQLFVVFVMKDFPTLTPTAAHTTEHTIPYKDKLDSIVQGQSEQSMAGVTAIKSQTSIRHHGPQHDQTFWRWYKDHNGTHS